MNTQTKTQAAAILHDWPLLTPVNAALMLAAMAGIDYQAAIAAVMAAMGSN